MFSDNQNEEDLQEIKSLLITYLADKVVREADKSFKSNERTIDIFKKWKNEHFRKPA